MDLRILIFQGCENSTNWTNQIYQLHLVNLLLISFCLLSYSSYNITYNLYFIDIEILHLSTNHTMTWLKKSSIL